MNPWVPRAILGIIATVVGVELLTIAPHPAVFVLAASAAWMAWPGVFLVSSVLPPETNRTIAWLVGPALGLGFSVFGLLLLWSAGIQNWLALLLAPALTWLVGLAARRLGAPVLRWPSLGRLDVAIVGAMLLVVPLVTFAPYDHVAEPVADGEAYRAYFTADFVWAMTVASEISKGDVPPVNPFLKGQLLHYYWMAHMLSGALYRNARPLGATVEQVILIDGIAFGLAAVAFLYFLARSVGGGPIASAIAVLAAFIANSYEGANRLWVLYQRHAGFHQLKVMNVDAVTRWFYQGMPVDGLQRMLLYQPHHLTGYMLSLSALWLVTLAADVTQISVALCAGVLLGLGFLFSTFTAIIVGLAVGLVFATRLIAARQWRAIVPAAILGGGPVLIAVFAATILGYTDPSQGFPLIFGLNPVALRRWPLMLFLSFGPLLFGGIAGLFRVRWVSREGLGAAALVLSAIAFYFLADVPDEQGVWVGWRSGHLLLIAFAVMSAAALTVAWRTRALRVPLAIVVPLVLLPATATVAIDVFNAQDITNRAQGPGFPWTFILTPPEREALDWLRASTPPDATVQYEPAVRGDTWWCYLTAFGERRMAAGLPGAMIPRKPYQMASENVRLGIFKAGDATDAHTMAKYLGIDYVFTGPVERRAYRPAIEQMAAHPELFRPAFQNDVITIFEVVK